VTVDELADLLRSAREAVVSTLSALFLGLSSYRENDAEVFARQAMALILAGQRTVAEIVALYVQQTAQAATVTPENPTGIPIPPITIPDVDVLGRLPGSDEFSVIYQRPFVTIWAELARRSPVAPDVAPDPLEVDGSMTKAVAKGVDRLERMADVDLQQAASRAATAAMQRLPEPARPTHWRRRLIGEDNCALCTIASTMRYTIEHLKPIHPGCDCQVEPIYPGQDDPDDDALLEAAHAAVLELTGDDDEDRGGRAVDYRKITLSMERHHGELAAPLLANPRHDFTTASQIPDSQPGDR
jgi:hypothetical protein